MIKNILLPEKVGSYYLFSKKILGIHIGKTTISATLVRAHGNTLFVERHIEHPIENSHNNSLQEQTAQTLKQIVIGIGSYNELRTALSSNYVIFKELRLPFLNPNQMRMVLNFEIEPLLPFPVQNAIIDFIITKQDLKEKNSEILVAATLKEHVANHLELFAQAGLSPDHITVDFLALYGLFTMMPEAIHNQSVVLFDIDYQTTRLAHIQSGQLRQIRSLNKGIISIAKSVSEQIQQPLDQVLDNILRFGLTAQESDPIKKALAQALAQYWQPIQMTLDSFALQQKLVQKIYLFGSGATIKGLTDYITQLSHIICEPFPFDDLFKEKKVVIKKGTHIPLNGIMSLSIALPSPVIETCNMRQKEFQIVREYTLLTQLIVCASLVLLCIGFLFTYTLVETRALRKELKASEQEAVKRLKNQFKQIPFDENDLEDVVSQAQQALTKEKATWFAFSGASRASFLEYLLELTSHIDKESLGFSVDKITITPDSLTLKAQVRDHEALKVFERELQKSPLFSFIEPQNDPAFTMKITLNKEGKEL